MHLFFVSALMITLMSLLDAIVVNVDAGDGKDKKNEVQKKINPKLPRGVVLIKLPPGEIRVERIKSDGRPIIRISVEKTVVEGETLYFGDGVGAAQYEAVNEGIRWVPPDGIGGAVVAGFDFPDRLVIDRADFLKVEQLKPGNVYLMTPSVKFEFGPKQKP